ncbi:MAG: hypothetical protein IPO28_14310 [Holophagaceae bacterium]|nr:hypothetical protein [Holophagaceae bacterium]
MFHPIPRPEELLNRELSWLDFNARVMEEAEDSTVPLLERVKFLSIVSSNWDEFFMVRVAGIWRQIDAGITQPGPDGLTPRQLLERVSSGSTAIPPGSTSSSTPSSSPSWRPRASASSTRWSWMRGRMPSSWTTSSAASCP